MKDAINRLSETILEQNEQLQELSDQVSKLVPAVELDERLNALEGRLGLRSRVFLAIAVVLAATFAAIGHVTSDSTARSVGREARARSIAACHIRNQGFQIIRDIVDRSQTSQHYDLSKLSPDTKKVLAEVRAAAPPQQDPASFHSFVYSKTEPSDCSKL